MIAGTDRLERAARPLARHVRVRTRDEGQAVHESNRLMTPHIVKRLDNVRFGWELNATQMGRSTVIYHSNRSAVEVEASAPTDCFILHVVLNGEVCMASDLGRVELAGQGSACIVSPTRQLHLRCAPGTEQFVVRIPIASMDQAFGRMTGEGGGRDIAFELRAPEYSAWPSTLLMAVNTIDHFDSGMPLPARLGEEMERVLTSSILLAQPHSGLRLLTQPVVSRASRAVAEVAEQIASAPHEPVDFAGLAESHGIALRTLQDGFQQRFGRSPSRFLRDARLDMAHTALSSDPHASVTEAALQAGFNHLGRFSRDYRDRFGSTPSKTLENTKSRIVGRAAG